MAEGIFNHLAKGKNKAFSAGTFPAEEVNPLAIKVMTEIGIDILRQKPILITPKMVKGADKVVSMGCIGSCPAIKIDEDWEIENPKGKGIEKFREVRDIIYKKVENEIT